MKKWIITCNPKYYDVVGAFNAFESVNGKVKIQEMAIGNTKK